MRNFKYVRNILLVLAGSLVLGQAVAAAQPVVEGTDYTVLTTPVQKTPEPKGKVNVKEFFSFTCIHCKDVDPMVEGILIPNKKIDMSKIHVTWDATTSNYAKLNATLQLMKLNNLYTPAFTATFARQDLNDQTILKAFLSQNGLNADQVNKFMSTYGSFTVNSKVSEYKSQMNTYNITGTPTFIVADTYVVKPAQPERLIEVVLYLVNKATATK